MDSFLLPCPFKYLTGIDCPGCGFQRSLLALFKGDLSASFDFYPPTILFLISISASAIVYAFKLDKNSGLLKFIYFSTGAVVLLNYGYKIFTHQLH